MAIINVSPADNLTELIASAAVSPGDVLLLADGIYTQSVVIEKNDIRVISQSGKAIFSGFFVLINGFILNGVTGTLIYGVEIRNYFQNGIVVTGGSANRIVSNRITVVGGTGIVITSSAENLVWKNRISEVGADGILMISGSTGNRILENHISDCAFDGIETFLSPDANNVIVENDVRGCGDNCFEIFGINCFVYGNKAVEAAQNAYLVFSGPYTALLENKGLISGRGLYVNISNIFAACNSMVSNGGTGVLSLNDYGIYQENLIENNGNSGLLLSISADNNFIFENRIVGNDPADITDSGTGNTFLKNQTGPIFPPIVCDKE
ncbi:right-handed parallel beta-helix repeat-containing protein [Anoxybacterium hadale]|uniref:Right-handed parallel beta-helix repeat-containing protein n=1 Tax=Anoxybacterium hadale TaxID=3408580 RepID=A0ACD1A6K6_9FIRM|nr:right-handed parallel beta-helix repeat-containing protein [Clostridiales bacterium]